MWDGMRTRQKPTGRHPSNRLTPVSIKAKKAPGRYADGNGLYLVVDPSGAKRWIWRGIVPAHDKRCDLGLGNVDVVPLSEARREALECRRKARQGDDLIAARRQQRRVVPTFADAARQVHAEHRKTFRNPKHVADWIASLEADVFPIIGQRPVHTIDSSDILRVLTPVWTRKPETARRLKQRMKVILAWATAAGHRPAELANPVDGVVHVLPRHKDTARPQPALPYAAVPAFVVQLRDAQTTDLIKLAFELLILTATRTSEVLGAQWSEIDRETKVWTIPAARIKAGREHRIPLSARCLELLDRAAVLSKDSSYVFPGRREGRPLSNMAFLMVLRRLKRADLVPHGFRSSFRDWAAERTNATHAVCESALAHVIKNKTEAAYHRTDYLEQRRDLMDLWSRFATSTPATVLAIGSA